MNPSQTIPAESLALAKLNVAWYDYLLPRYTTPLTFFKMLVLRPKPPPGLVEPSKYLSTGLAGVAGSSLTLSSAKP